MANDYFTPNGTPATGAFGASSVVRSDFAAIAAGFDKLPGLTGNAGKAVVVNSLGTGLTVTTGTLALAGNLATTGAFNTTLAQSASITLTLPAASGTLATLAGTETLTNKTLTSPTLTTPILGTPSSGTLSSCTGYPTASLTGLGAGVATFLATPSSANLRAAVTDETGSGALVFAVAPTFSNGMTLSTGTLNINTNSGAGISLSAGSVELAPNSSSRAPLKFSSTGSEPFSPNDGEMWFNGTSLKIQISGSTKTVTVS